MKRSTSPIYILLFFVLLASSTLFAQKGQLFITHFQPQSEHYDPQVFDIEQGEFGQMFIASRSGILSYNGEVWNNIKTPGTPFVLKYDTLSKRMWVGCKNSLGFLVRESNGRYNYQELFNVPQGATEFRSLNIFDSIATFYSDPLVISVKTSELAVKDTVLIEQGFGSGMISLGKEVFVVKRDGIYKITGLELVKADLKASPENKKLIFNIEINGQALTGWDDGSIYFFDGKGFSEWMHEGKNFLKENFLTGAIAMAEGKVALSTITGGSIVVDEAGKVQYYLNYNTGLPDDEILAAGIDDQGGLWLAHDYGLSRIDLRLPLRNYAFYPGLSGNILAVAQYNKTMYVGTSEGLFSLVEVKDYDELEIFLKKKDKNTEVLPKETTKKRFSFFSGKDKEETSTSTVSAKQSTDQTSTVSTKTEGKKESKGVLGGLFKKNKKEKEEPQVVASKPIEEVKKEEPKSEPLLSRISKKNTDPAPSTKKIYKLRSIKYQYIKVSGMDAKTEKLDVFAGSLWASTNLGLYEIKDGKSSRVISVRDIYSFSYDEANNVILLATGSGIKILAKENGKWVEKPDYSGVVFPVFSFTKDKASKYWFTSDNIIGSFGLNNGKMDNISLNEIENPFSDIIYAGMVQDTVRFFLSDLVYCFNATSSTIEPDLTLNRIWRERPQLFEDKNDLWISSGKNWSQLEGESSINLAYLRLFRNIESLYEDADKNLWIIVGHQQLFKIPSQKDDVHEVFPVFVSSVFSISGQPLTMQNLTLEHDENGLSFYFASPFYLSEKSVEYQYFIEGLMETWSAWAPDSKVQLPFLPTGDYKLHVKARNIFGQEIESQAFEYSVKPPYWYTWWFYLLEVIFFSTLIVISIYLNTSGQQTFFTKALTFLTLIIIIELVSTVVENTFKSADDTPLFEFLLNVVLALSIYPLEQLMSSLLAAKNLAKTKELLKAMKGEAPDKNNML